MAGGYVSPTSQTAGTAIPTSRLNSYKAGLDTFAAPAAVYLYQLSSFTTIASSSTVWVPLAWDTVGWDTQAGWAGAGANAARWVCPTGWAGRYEWTATVSYGTGTSGGRRYAALAVNGINPAAGFTRGPDNYADTNGITVESTGEYLLNVGDYAQCVGMQTSGASISTRNAVSGAVCSSLRLRWISAT